VAGRKNLECVSCALTEWLKQKLSSGSTKIPFCYLFFFCSFFGSGMEGVLCLQVDLFFIYRHISEFLYQTENMSEIRSIRIPKRSLFRAKISLFPILASTCCCRATVKHSFSRFHWNAFSMEEEEEYWVGMKRSFCGKIFWKLIKLVMRIYLKYQDQLL
jgi:hypothetical protein